MELLQWFSHLSWSYFWVGSVSALFLVMFYAGLALLLCPWRRQSKAIGITVLVFLGSTITVMQHALPRPGRTREAAGHGA